MDGVDGGLLLDHGEQSDRRAGGLVRARLPLADGLLADTKGRRECILGEAQGFAQLRDRRGIAALVCSYG